MRHHDVAVLFFEIQRNALRNRPKDFEIDLKTEYPTPDLVHSFCCCRATCASAPAGLGQSGLSSDECADSRPKRRSPHSTRGRVRCSSGVRWRFAARGTSETAANQRPQQCSNPPPAAHKMAGTTVTEPMPRTTEIEMDSRRTQPKRDEMDRIEAESISASADSISIWFCVAWLLSRTSAWSWSSQDGSRPTMASGDQNSSEE